MRLFSSITAANLPKKSKGITARLSQPGQLAIAAIGITALHIIFGDDMFSLLSRVFAGAIGFAAYHSVLQVARLKERTELPFRELYVVLFYIFFGLPVFWQDEMQLIGTVYIPNMRALDMALGAGVLSLAVFYVCYPLGQRLGRSARPLVSTILPKSPPSKYSGWFTLLIAVPVVMRVTYLLTFSPGSISPELQRLVVGLAPATLLLALALHLDEMFDSRLYRIAAIIVFLTSMAIGLLSGMLEAFLIPLAVMAVYRWLSSKRTRLLWILSGLLLFIILNPAKLDYRADIGNLAETQSEVTVGDRLGSWQDAVSSKWSVADNVEENLDSSRSRMADLLPVAQVMEFVPDNVPYANGKPWMALPYSLIPRAIWPNKPDLTQMTNGEYALAFNRLSDTQVKVTAFNLPQLADGYWNFGWPGVVFVAILAGLSMGFKASAFDTRGWATCVLGIVFFINVRPQADLATLVVGIIQTFLAGVVFIWLLVMGESIMRPRRWKASPVLQPKLR